MNSIPLEEPERENKLDAESSERGDNSAAGKLPVYGLRRNCDIEREKGWEEKEGNELIEKSQAHPRISTMRLFRIYTWFFM